VEVWGVIALPVAAVDVTTGAEPGGAPVLTTKISNDGPPVGAGAHWKAQPMFQVPPAMLNEGLVQFPLMVVCGTRTVAGPTAAGTDVELDPAAVVDVALAGAVVAVAEPPAAVVAVEPAGGGTLYPLLPLLLADPDDEPVLPLNHMPTTAATMTATTSCQVFQDRRSLNLRSPFWGTTSGSVVTGPGGGATGGTTPW
jgi:hypothetical protein